MIIEDLQAPLGWLLTAILGLVIWRVQLLAERRYEVAERALTTANAATQALNHIRNSKLELARDPRLQHDYHVVVSTRLFESANVFTDLELVGELVQLHFGESPAELFRNIEAIHRKIIESHTSLMTIPAAEIMFPTNEQIEERRLWNATVSAAGENDPMTARINNTYAAIKERFGPYLRPSFWDFLLPFRR